jgi:hypothetical protein
VGPQDKSAFAQFPLEVLPRLLVTDIRQHAMTEEVVEPFALDRYFQL